MQPLALSLVVLFSGTPTAIEAKTPPISPPICAKLSIPVTMNPINRFRMMIGIIWLFRTLPKYTL